MATNTGFEPRLVCGEAENPTISFLPDNEQIQFLDHRNETFHEPSNREFLVRILLVEDDETLADGLSHSLAEAGFDLALARTGAHADGALLTQDYDLVILDLGLPDTDGREVLRRLRARKSPVPVLILTARDSLEDRVAGLELGADDYLGKPFELRELEAPMPLS